MAFRYDGIGRTDLEFETVLREGINLAEAGDDRSASVELDVTFHALDADQLRAKLDRGASLSVTEIAEYFDERSSAIDDGRVQAKVTDY